MKLQRISRFAMAPVLIAAALLSAGEPAAPAKVFETPEAAWQALIDTFQTGDWDAVQALLGPAASRIPLGTRTPQRLQKTAEDASKAEMEIKVQDQWATFVVAGRPFPIAAQKTARGWVLGDNPTVRDKQAALVNQQRCLTNLRAIRKAIQDFQVRNNRPPVSLESLIKDEKGKGALNPSEVLCPMVEEGKHRVGADGVPCDYLYIPLNADAPKNTIMAFCPRWNHPDGVRTCAFTDSRADKIEKEEEFRTALKASLKAAGISVENPRPGAAELPEGNPARDPEWRKAIRAELGLEKPPASSGQKASEGARKRSSSKSAPK